MRNNHGRETAGMVWIPTQNRGLENNKEKKILRLNRKSKLKWVDPEVTGRRI